MAARGLDNIAVVLVGTKYSGNLGSVARAMYNMDLRDLRLVRPECRVDEEAARMARGGVGILHSARRFRSLRSSLRGVGHVTGTTARRGGNRREVRSPRDMAPRLLELSASRKAAVVFGPEDTGLVDDDLLLCNQLIRIPTSAAFRSLNLSQAVMIVAYELFLADLPREPRISIRPARATEVEAMYAQLEAALFRAGFLHAKNSRHMMFAIRRLLGRAALEAGDVAILRGISRQIEWLSRRGPASD